MVEERVQAEGRADLHARETEGETDADPDRLGLVSRNTAVSGIGVRGEGDQSAGDERRRDGQTVGDDLEDAGGPELPEEL